MQGLLRGHSKGSVFVSLISIPRIGSSKKWPCCALFKYGNSSSTDILVTCWNNTLVRIRPAKFICISGTYLSGPAWPHWKMSIWTIWDVLLSKQSCSEEGSKAQIVFIIPEFLKVASVDLPSLAGAGWLWAWLLGCGSCWGDGGDEAGRSVDMTTGVGGLVVRLPL